MSQKVKIYSNPKTEAQHQVNLFNWSLVNRDKYPELKYLHHIPNGGYRDNAEAAHLKAQGVKPGIPDLNLPVPRGGYHGLYIELKTEKGRASHEQEWWISQLNSNGYFAEICHGWDSAVNVIEWYLTLEVQNDSGRA